MLGEGGGEGTTAGSPLGGRDSLGGWLRGRSPVPPEPLLRLLLEEGGDGPVGVSVLADRAVAAFRRALAAPGRVRSSAFHLLVGDALLTYACELLARSPDVEGGLKTLLARVAEGLEPASPGADRREEGTSARRGP